MYVCRKNFIVVMWHALFLSMVQNTTQWHKFHHLITLEKLWAVTGLCKYPVNFWLMFSLKDYLILCICNDYTHYDSFVRAYLYAHGYYDFINLMHYYTGKDNTFIWKQQTYPIRTTEIFCANKAFLVIDFHTCS